jgi:hypothetical protein
LEEWSKNREKKVFAKQSRGEIVEIWGKPEKVAM